MDESETLSERPKPRRRVLGALPAVVRICLSILLALAVGMGGVVLWAQGRDIPVPDWVRVQIDERLVEVIPNASVQFGDMIMVVDEGWRPRVRVSDVRLFDTAGSEIVAFSEVRASMAMRPLLNGQLDLKSVDLSGVFATVRRNSQRGISISAGAGTAALETSATRPTVGVVQLVTDLDELLLRPGLAALTRANIYGLTLRYEDEIARRAWTADGGRVSLTRSGDDLRISADLAILDGDADAATIEANYFGEIGSTAAEVGVSVSGADAGDIATQSPAFAWMSALDAPISISLRGGLSDAGELLPLNASLQIGEGVIQPTDAALPIPIESVRSYFRYFPDEQRLRFDELFVSSKWVSGVMEGDTLLGGLNAGVLTEIVGQLQVRELKINPRDLYREPVEIAAADMDFRLSLAPFELQVGRLQIDDQGQTLNVRGRLGANALGWTVSADADMDAISRARLLELWPEGVVPKSRTWINDNLLAGEMSNIVFALRSSPGSPLARFLSVDFDKTKVRYLKTMPVVQDAQGQFTLTSDRFVVALDHGRVEAVQGGDLDIAGSSFIIPDVRVKGGAPAILRLRTTSSVTAVLSMLNSPPMNLMDKANRPVDLAAGTAQLNGNLAFTLRRRPPGAPPPRPEDHPVEYAISGTLHDISSDTLVPNRALQAETLSVEAVNTSVTIAGPGTLDGVPFEGGWTQPTGKARTGRSQVVGQIEVSPRTLGAFGINLPQDMVSGVTQAQVQVDLSKGEPPVFALTSGLQGLGLNVQPISWRKAADVTGQLSVAGALGDVPRIDELSVSGPGMSARGRVSLTQSGALERLQIDRLTVGDWLDAPVDLNARGTGVPLGIAVRGGTLDLRNARFGPSGGSGARAPLTVALDRVQITEAIALQDVQGQFMSGGGLEGAFSGKINGGAEVAGRLAPQGGRTAVQMRAQNAGDVLASAKLLDQVEGGALELSLIPVGPDDAFDGRLNISNTSVQDAPVLAALLNAVSIVGLVAEISGSGIFFSQVDARFRMTPSRITLTQASAEGPSMGLSMDGIYDTATRQVDMRGVVSPIYLLNGIGSVLTRRGEGLIGFSYTLRGDAKSPKVSVNPLSVLAPGMLRELFRGEPPSVQPEQGEPAPQPTGPRPEPALNDASLAGAGVGR